MATLDLIKELVAIVTSPETSNGSRITDFIACVVFVCRDVFNGYQKWYYGDLKEKQEIGRCSFNGITCLQAAIAEGLHITVAEELTRGFTLYKLLVPLYAVWRARFSALNRYIVIFHPPEEELTRRFTLYKLLVTLTQFGALVSVP